jgi:hypothetical protein
MEALTIGTNRRATVGHRYYNLITSYLITSIYLLYNQIIYRRYPVFI